MATCGQDLPFLLTSPTRGLGGRVGRPFWDTEPPMSSETASELLNAARAQLGYEYVKGESFHDASDRPSDFDERTWVDKGDWLAVAKKIGAEAIFFVENNPVVVFAKCNTDDETALRCLYDHVWSMARPRMFFLAKPGELAVYDLARRPPHPGEALRSLQVAHTSAEVGEKLRDFRREQIETGCVFEAEKRFGKGLRGRADQALIDDLKKVRKALVDAGLSGKRIVFAHALIGRSIFIRYLEDRGILTPEYFRGVAGANRNWSRTLDAPAQSVLWLEPGQAGPVYPKVLRNHAFTYALFARLAKDFNGDMFPNVEEEAKVVEQKHLTLIRDLMYGDVGRQKKLFFQAYRFDIIPIELISSIYEEFYHEESGGGKAHGAFYTPPALVEFLVSRTLTRERLETGPKIVDPACGSGIFLVEAFRRIVRYRTARQRRRLRFDELQKILRDQLAGIDINEETIRIAAFSLYLAILHYLEPPDILAQIEAGNRLPPLVARSDGAPSFNCLLVANAFLRESYEATQALKERFSSGCADAVLGNPPWASAGLGDKAKKAREANQVALDWCAQRQLPVGDERSQTFIWRALDLLRPGGTAGLLVSTTGVLYKHGRESVAFRRKWVRGCELASVLNFAHARTAFFASTTSPFAAVIFHKGHGGKIQQFVDYWSAKRTSSVDGLQAVVFSAGDLHVVGSNEDLSDHTLWKTMWWGNHRDRRLMAYLRGFKELASLTTPNSKGQGFKKASRAMRADWLGDYEQLLPGHFRRYGPLAARDFGSVPDRVERRGVREIYSGTRLLVGRGIGQKGDPKGQIVARLEDNPFAFTHAIHGVKLPSCGPHEHRVALGILWSSLARYFLFMTAANWGAWHDDVGLDEELLALPIRFPEDARLRERILRVVDELREHYLLDEAPTGAQNTMTREKCRELEAKLDRAIFELYGLGEEEVDLVRDLCDTGLDFLYRRGKSDAVRPVATCSLRPPYGNAASVPPGMLGEYLGVFMQGWAAYLNRGEELHWQVHMPPGGDSMLAAVFTVHDRGDRPAPEEDEEGAWSSTLRRLDEALRQPISSRIYIEGLARAVTDDGIMIVKRNERRLWTKSMAREDIEATLVQAMNRKSVIGERQA